MLYHIVYMKLLKYATLAGSIAMKTEYIKTSKMNYLLIYVYQLFVAFKAIKMLLYKLSLSFILFSKTCLSICEPPVFHDIPILKVIHVFILF